MPTSNIIQNIIQKHVDAAGREIAALLRQELTQQLADRFGSPHEAVETRVNPATEPHSAGTLTFDSRTRRWICAKCHTFSDVRRRAVTAHMRFCPGAPKLAPKPAPRRKPKKNKKS
jgi:hypothetical protein